MNRAIRNFRFLSTKTTLPLAPLSPPTPLKQAPNRGTVWSKSQMPRNLAMTGPRFEQTTILDQPSPMAAIELINLAPTRIASCDGGGGALGHPKDTFETRACGYCGNKFRFEPRH